MSTVARLTLSIVGILSLLLALLAVPLPAQNRDVPVIRTTSRLVQLNVVVLDNHRRPVNDLSRDDFEVFDNGREQKLSHFSVASARAAAARSAAPSLVRTNRPAQNGDAPSTVFVSTNDPPDGVRYPHPDEASRSCVRHGCVRGGRRCFVRGRVRRWKRNRSAD